MGYTSPSLQLKLFYKLNTSLHIHVNKNNLTNIPQHSKLYLMFNLS